VTLIPKPAELSVGQWVEVDVSIQNATDIGHAPFHLKFDPAVLRFDRGAEGPFLKSDGRPTAFFASPMSTPGTVVVGLSRLGRTAGVSGAGLLCTLYFEAIGSGRSNLTFERLNVRSPSHGILESDPHPALIMVN
jgi:hypothetical protein